MRMRPFHLVAALLAAALSQAHAANRTWSGSISSFWNIAGNWDTPPVLGTDAIVFAGSNNPATTNDFAANSTFTGITFNSNASAFTLGGNAVTLGGNISFDADPPAPVIHAINLDLVLNGNRSFGTQLNGTITVNGVIRQDGTNRGLTYTAGSNGTLQLLNTANTFGGAANLQGRGIVQVARLADTGTASSLGTGNGTPTIQIGQQSFKTTLEYIGPGASTTNRSITVGSGAAATHTAGSIIKNSATDPAHTLAFTNATFNIPVTQNSTINRPIALGGNNTGDNFIAGVIQNNNAGTISLTKTDAGKWILAGNNTHTGGTTFDGGILRADDPGAFGNNGNLTFTGGTLQYTANTSTTDWTPRIKNSTSAVTLDTNGQDVTLNGFINSTNTGGFSKLGAGNLTLNSANAYNGTTTVSGGTLKLGTDNAVSTTGQLLVRNGTLDLDGFNQTINATAGANTALNFGGMAGATAEIRTGAGTLTLVSNNATLAAITYNATENPLGAAISGNLVYNSSNDNLLFSLGDSNATDEELTVSANIAKAGTPNTGTFYSTGEGTLVLSGNNTFDPLNLQIRGGRWILAAGANAGSGTLGAGAETVDVGYATQNNNAALLLMQGVTSERNIEIARYTAGNGSFTRTIGGVNTAGSSAFNGNVTVNDNAKITAAAGGTVFFNGVISGTNASFTVEKTGHGAVAFSGTNTYPGNTTVSAGTLLVDGYQAAAMGDVAVAPGATLGGTGTLGGNTTLDSGAGLAFDLSTGPARHRHLSINGGLACTGDSNLIITTTGNAIPGNYTLVATTDGITGSLPSLNLPPGWIASPSVSGNNLVLAVLSTNGMNFGAWAALHGTSANQTANDDGDKFTNSEEYAFDLDPGTVEFGNVLTSETGLSNGNITLTLAFNGNSSKTDANYVVRRSPDPGFTANTIVGQWNGTANWTTSNSTYFANQTQTGDGTVKAVNVNLSLPAATVPRQFLRVDVLCDPPPPVPGVELSEPADNSTTDMVHPHFKWEPVANADRYEIQIASDSGFTTLQQSDSIPVPRFVPNAQLPDCPAGTVYWWRVRTVFADGTPGNWSAPSKLTITSITNIHNILLSDSLDTLRSKIADALASAPCRIVFEPGTYNLDLADDEYLFYLNGKRDVVIDGNLCAINLHNPKSGFSQFESCEDVLLRQFNIDYVSPEGEPVTHTAGTIVSVEADGVVFHPFDGYLPPTDPRIRDATERRWGCLMDPVTPGRLKIGVNNWFDFKPEVTDLGSGQYKLYLVDDQLNRLPNFAPGDILVKNAVYAKHLMYSTESKNITYEMVTSYGSSAPHFIGHWNDGIHFLRCASRIKEGRYISNGCGGYVGNGYLNGFWIEECLTEGMLDDASNLSNYPATVQAKLASNRFTVSGAAAKFMNPGDCVTIYTPTSGAVNGTFPIISIAKTSGVWEITVVGDIGEVDPGPENWNTLVYNDSRAQHNAYVRNCTFRNARRYGCLFKSHGGVIEGCEFRGLSEAAIMARNDCVAFNDGFDCRNVRILSNKIYDCGYSSLHFSQDRGSIEFSIATKSPAVCTTTVHQNPYLWNNEIYDWDGRGLRIECAQNPVIEANIVKNQTATSFYPGGQNYGIFLRYTDGAQILDNDLRDARPMTAPLQIEDSTGYIESGNLLP